MSLRSFEEELAGWNPIELLAAEFLFNSKLWESTLEQSIPGGGLAPRFSPFVVPQRTDLYVETWPESPPDGRLRHGQDPRP